MKAQRSENTGQAKPQIIYAWNYLEWGGAQIYFFAIIKEVKKHFDVRIVLPEKSDEQLVNFIRKLEVPFDFIPTFADSKSERTLIGKFQKHRNKIDSENILVKHLQKYDLKNSIVHVELGPWQSLVALLRLASKTCVFITAHNSIEPLSGWRFLHWKAKMKAISKFKNFNIFCSNEDAKNRFRKYFPNEFVERIKVTYTSVNPPEIDEALALEFNSDALKRRFDIPTDKFLVLCVGQFIDRKGRWTYLEAAKKVCEQTGDVAFVWISNSQPSDEDLRKAESFGLGENFKLITSDRIGKNRIDLFKMFRLADVYVLASLVEGLPISLLEAMALGIPSISTNVFAIPEAVKNLDTGILIEAGDAYALGRAIIMLKEDADLREKLSKNGREWVLKTFDERDAARIAIGEYKRALGIK